MMVAATLELENERDPLALAEKSNVGVSRKPRNREVSSRYKIAGSGGGVAAAAPPPPPPPTVRRFPSPNVGRLGDAPAAPAPLDLPPKRAISAERKRNGDDKRGAAKEVWSSCQNIVTGSSQGAILCDDKAKIDHALKPAANRPRVATPERKRSRQGADQAENARPIENVGGGKLESQRWSGTANGKSISRSLDLSMGRASSIGTKGNRCLVPARSFNQLTGKLLEPTKKPSKPADSSSLGDETKTDTRCVRSVPDDADLASCDSDAGESVKSSLDSQRSSLDSEKSSSRPSKAARGTVVPARFWQDLGSRIRRLSDVNQLRSSMPEGEFLGSKTSNRRSNKSGNASGGNSAPSSTASTPAPSQAPSWVYSPVRAVSSTVAPQPSPPPSSPSKVSSPSRGLPSPTRTRALPSGGAAGFYQGVRPGSVACMLNFGNDSSTGRRAMSQQDEALCLRILHNRWLQWRYVNARSQATLSAQKATGERMLYNASLQISDLQSRVAEKRIRLQKAKQDLKVRAVIAAHGEHLDEWEELEPEHAIALSGFIAALEAATLKVPVTGGAKVDIPALQNALTLLGDAMVPLESTTRELLPRAEKTNEIVCQLAHVSSQGKALLQECGEILDRIATLEIEERSLRSYVVQLDNEKKRTTTARK
ncbi:hypothetical protein SELMODRAFT_407120 [Selaginella moellendorffii]|uniref:Uncharacterized protein n=1 Tax=Selaginella moellendorffii TaxID=88036 RepID=D8R3Z2_SELML|nr:QWRF motif-containing protein 2 [Selaginella moellendorffii]EFJ33370.1 hypothetical protein SELMODRAFT_407120 [Selaginella moellendorffii]|eukprot:XP_002965950.1 QWRF motif-containing protein 2 [Selaginella moellendorffii]